MHNYTYLGFLCIYDCSDVHLLNEFLIHKYITKLV